MPTPEANARDLVYVLSEITHKYPKQTKQYVAEFVGCCRLGPLDAGDLVNNPSGAWSLRSHVSLTDSALAMDTGTAASPMISHVPMFTLVLGKPTEFMVHAVDAARRPIKFRLGKNTDFGVGINTAAQEPYGNAMKATINADTGVVSFPASADTVYPGYYNIVVVVSTVGPCSGYMSTDELRQCVSPEGTPQAESVTALLDFLVRVVNAGFKTQVGALNSCTDASSGLPAGTRVCNNPPILMLPSAQVKFICNEHNSFDITATDGNGVDKSLSVPHKGVFAIRYRQRPVLNSNYPKGQCSNIGGRVVRCMDHGDCAARGIGYCTNMDFVPHFPREDQQFWRPGNRAIAGIYIMYKWIYISAYIDIRIYMYIYIYTHIYIHSSQT